MEGTSGFPEIVRYYEKDDDGTIYIRAVPGDDGLVEVKNPVFIKPTLIVGETWFSYPTFNMSSYINNDIADMELKAQCKIFVVEKDSINLLLYFFPYRADSTVEAIQLDQVAEISATIQSEGTHMELGGKLLSHLFFADSIGIVAMQEHVELLLKGTIADQYGSVRLNMAITIEDNLKLTNVPPLMKQRSKLLQRIPGKVPVDAGNISHQIIKIFRLMML